MFPPTSQNDEVTIWQFAIIIYRNLTSQTEMYMSDSDAVDIEPTSMDQGLDRMLDTDNDNSPTFSARKKRSKASTDDMNVHSRLLDSHIKIALSLYKVQQNIYLLDFQRIEVRLYISCLLLCR